ncbi:MAG: T9SS type A sorting domain-containing protein [Fibrobacteres bacterium]|nr:T9SS type A sorting domain-containing protein [Fibrobacterota bacterium]
MNCFKYCYLLLAVSIGAVPVFISEPVFNAGAGSDYTIKFTLSEETDVEIAVIDSISSKIVRHLAAGRLGLRAPYPLQANSLSQTITWDGRDDNGRSVGSGIKPLVRVRCGMVYKLANVVDASPHLYSVTLTGLHLDPDGSLYTFGNSGLYNGEFGNATNKLRKFDKNGNYLKTIFPPPAGSAASVTGSVGAVLYGVNSFRLRTWMSAGPGLGDPLNPISGQTNILCPFKVDGKLMVVNIPGSYNNSLNFALVSPVDGSMSVAPLITSPALPMIHDYNGPWSGGPIFLSMWPDGKSLLLTAFYQSNVSSTIGWFPADTGFWRDGRAYRIDIKTGVATPFISLDPAELPKNDSSRKAIIGPKWAGSSHLNRMAVFHGTAFDDSGHVFICDRLNQRISVYDTTGLFLSSFKVADPDVIVFDRATGALYILARNITSYGGGFIHLYKYSSWRNPRLLASSMNITTGLGSASSIVYQPRASLVVDTNVMPRVLWVASKSGRTDAQNGFWRFEDRSDTIVKTFASSDRYAGDVPDPDRLAVDPSTGTLFVQHPYTNLSKIDDWSNPKLRPCSTTAGTRIYAADMQVSQAGYLYLRQQPNGVRNAYPVLDRWTLGKKHAPAPYNERGTNVVTSSLIEHFSNGVAAHGLDIYRDSIIAVMHRPFSGKYYVQMFDTSGKLLEDSLVSMNGQCGGVQFDKKGNLYVGALSWADSHVVEEGFSDDWGYRHYVGTVIKYDRMQHGSFSPATFSLFTGTPRQVKPQGAVGVYANAPVAPISGRDRDNQCVCRVPRFMVDPYGRIFSANAVTGKISVVDNNDNIICRFGDYGNNDSYGADSPVPEPVVPLMWPTSVVADDDFIYVADPGNSRIVRVRMDYLLNSQPGFSAVQKKGVEPEQPVLSGNPNPFNPTVTITYSVSGEKVHLGVYDLEGKLVAVLADGIIGSKSLSKYNVIWNGRTVNGMECASGIYFARLKTGSVVKAMKLILNR